MVLSDGAAYDVKAYDALPGVFGNLHLDETTSGRLASYASERLESRTEAATVRRGLVTLSCLWCCAVAWDFIKTGPIRQFSKRHIESHYRRRPIRLASWLVDMASTAVAGREEAVDRRHGPPCRCSFFQYERRQRAA